MKKKVLLLLMLILTVVFLSGCQESIATKYTNAQTLMAEGKFSEAAEKFESLGSYEESSMLAMYCKAAAAGESGDYDTALSGFRGLGEYKDSRMMLDYYYARSYEDGNWQNKLQAATMFEQNSLFRDSANRAENCRRAVYEEAQRLRSTGDYDDACNRLDALGRYQNAASQIPEVRYQQGAAKREAGDWDGAVEAFQKAGSYSDAAEQIKETQYLKAKDLASQGDYARAVAIFIGIKGYKDVDSLLTNDPNLAAAAARYTAGNYVTFGHYPQSSEGNDTTEIEWLVLARDGNKALLISRYGLDAKPYNTAWTSITWEECTLRTWLNGTFLNKAFTAEEQKGILLTNVDNGSGQGYSEWSTYGGNNTQDRVFLLSYAEANKYLSVTYDDENNMKSRVAPTAYALKQGAYTSGSNITEDGTAAGWWWLRSPGFDQHNAASVYTGGSLGYYNVSNDNGCVRPALWINLESGIF